MAKKQKLATKIEKETIASVTESPARKCLSAEIAVERSTARQKSYVMDLRIHSPSSLGYLGIEGIDTAPALVRLARVKGIDVIAVTDFYSGHYINRIMAAAKGTEVTVIPGVMIRCAIDDCDDVVLSCLFPQTCTSERINEFLHALGVPASTFGKREYLVRLSMEKILDIVDLFEGIVLPSRMDKTPQRMKTIAALVERFGFRTFDLAYQDSNRFFKKGWPRIKFNLYSFSSANALAQVGSRIARVKLPQMSFEALKEVMKREQALGSERQSGKDKERRVSTQA